MSPAARAALRVAYVCADPGVPVDGVKGASVHVQGVVGALLARGVRVDLFAARCNGTAPEALGPVALHALPALPREPRRARERAALARNGALARDLAGTGPYDLVYERYSLWSYAAMEHARAQGVPGVLEVNAPLIEEQARYRALLDRAGAETATRRALDAATVIVAVSDGVAGYLDGFAEARGKVRVIPNGVCARRYAELPPATLSADAGVFTAGFVGTLKPWHGVSDLLRAGAGLLGEGVRTRLLIVGDGPQREALERLADDLGLTAHTVFTGAVRPDAVPGLLASMDAGVAPYPAGGDAYFSPLKAYEYMAVGLAVVGSDVGQLGTCVRHGETGLLCPAGDIPALQAALRMLARDALLRARLGAAGRSQVLAHHTWDRVVDAVLEGVPQAHV